MPSYVNLFIYLQYLNKKEGTWISIENVIQCSQSSLLHETQVFIANSRNLPTNKSYQRDNYFQSAMVSKVFTQPSTKRKLLFSRLSLWWKSFKARLKHFPPPLLCLSYSSHLPKGFCNHFRLQFAWLSLSLFFSSLPQSPHFLCGMKLMFVLWNWKEREYFSKGEKKAFSSERKILL